MSTYYVSATGDNSNNGLLRENSWKTINYGISQLSAGDTLIILSGVYNENLYIEKDGSAGNLITIKADDYSNKPHIIAESSSAVVRLRGSYLKLSGLKLNTNFAADHISHETGNHIIVEKNEINAEGYLGQHGILLSSQLADDVIIRQNKLRNIEGIPIKINCSGAEITYNLIDGFLTEASTQNIQLYIYHSGTFNIYNNTLVGGRSYGMYLGNSGIVANVKNNIIAYYGFANTDAYGLWIDLSATVDYDYNIITCNGINPNRTTYGGTDGGNNYIGLSYFPDFISLRSKGKFLLYNDDYLDRIEEAAAVADTYSLPVTGCIVYNYNSAEENLVSRLNALYANGHEVSNHTWSHASLLAPDFDYENEVDAMRDWLLNNINGYSANNVVYPGGLVSDESIDYLNTNGYYGGRKGNSSSSVDLRSFNIFKLTINPIENFVYNRVEADVKNFIKQHARFTACTPTISGLLTHTFTGSDPSLIEFGYMCEALSESSDYVDIPTLEQVLTEFRESGNWSSFESGKVWKRTNYADLSDYSLKTSSIGVHAGIDVGLSEDIEGNSILSSPTIGSYEYIEEGFYMNEFYVTPTGAGAHNGTSEANAWNWSEMVTAINDGTVTGDSRVNIKNSGTYAIGDTSITQSGSGYVWKAIEGYETNPGDGGVAYILRNSGSSHLLNFNGKNYWRIKNLKINGNNTGGINIIIGAYSQLENVESYNAGTVGIYGYALSQFVNCYSHNNGSDGFYDGRILYCIAEGNAGIGFRQVGEKCGVMYSIGKNNGSANFQLLKGVASNIISDGGSGRGILCYYDVTLLNAVLINHTSNSHYALHFPDTANDMPYACVKNINFYNNSGLGNCNKISYVDTYYTLDPQFSNTANLDYTRTGTNLDGLGFSDVGNLGYDYTVDIGISQYKNVPSYAAVTDVRLGVDRGDGSMGTLDLPSIADVEEGVQFDNATKVGTFSVPSEANVRHGTTYGNSNEFEGTLDLPSVNDVQDGVLFDGSTKEGTLSVPSVSDVRDGIFYGANDVEYEGTLDLPSEDDVRKSISFDNASKLGNLELPEALNVRNGIKYGTNGIEYEGTLDTGTVINGTLDLEIESSPVYLTIEVE